MKNTLRLILCLMLTMGMLLCFIGCDSDEDTDTTEKAAVKEYMVGKYEITKIQWEDGTSATGDTLRDAEETMGEMYVELFSDGTAQLSLLGQVHDMEFSDDEMWEIDYASNSYDFSVRDGKVTLEKDGEIYTFVKE